MFDVQAFERNGFAVVGRVLDADEVDALASVVSNVRPGGAARNRGGRVFARRNLLRDDPAVAAVAGSDMVRSLVEPLLGPDAFPVRGLLFDKTPGANWGVPWHQDLTIAVRARVDAPGFGPWTLKAGVTHVQPPVDVLERMVTVRLQLDDGGPSYGPVRVVPGSHRAGRLDAAMIREWLDRAIPVSCPVPRGGALLLKPLLLHASSPSNDPAMQHRRVIHLEFAAHPLPHGVAWDESEDRERREVVTQ